jgi:hypothetical protein
MWNLSASVADGKRRRLGIYQGRASASRLCGKIQCRKIIRDQQAAEQKNMARTSAAPGKTAHINYFLIDLSSIIR